MTDLFEKLDGSKKKQTGVEQEFLALDFFEAAKSTRKIKKNKEEQGQEKKEVPEQTADNAEGIETEISEEKAKESGSIIKIEVEAVNTDNNEEKIEKKTENIEIISTEVPLSVDKTEDIDNLNKQDTAKELRTEISIDNREKIIEKKGPVIQETRTADKSAENTDYGKDQKRSETGSVSGMTESHHINKKTVNEAGKSNMSQMKPVRSMGSLTGKDTSVGQTLHEAREAKGLSHIEVEQKTKIKAEFIRLLENDDFSRLPPLVYIVAYIKTLSTVYGIPPEDTMLLVSSIRKGKEAPVIADDVARNLEPEKPLSPELKAKNKKIIIISVIIGIVALLWIIGIVLLISNKGKKSNTKTPDLKPATITLKDTPPPATATVKPITKPAPTTPVQPVKTTPVPIVPVKTPASTPAPKPVETKDTKPAKTPEQPKDIKGKDTKKKDSTTAVKPIEEKPVVKFSGAELEKFIPPQTLAMSELPIDGKASKK